RRWGLFGVKQGQGTKVHVSKPDKPAVWGDPYGGFFCAPLTMDQSLVSQPRLILCKFSFSSIFWHFCLDKGNTVVLNYAQGTGMVTCSPNVLVRVTNNNKEEISK